MKTKEMLYQEKTLDAATNLILTKLDELRGDREENKDYKRRRWIWELIQNAKDSTRNRDISIKVDTGDDFVNFSHTGDCFTYENLVDLITQISTKVKDEEKVGKFGTGFISTHLLSDKVLLRGVYHEDKENIHYKRLELLLDRSGSNADEISAAIKNAFGVIDSLDSNQNIEYDPKSFSTSFHYEFDKLNAEVKKAIQMGRDDWERTIPLVLSFAENISSMEFDGIEAVKHVEKSNKEGVRNYRVEYTKNGIAIKNYYVSVINNDDIEVAVLMKYENQKWIFEDMTKYPKLFCTLPLVGTENFPFPIVINSKKFRVSQERNGIHESLPENQNILNKALSLYECLLNYWNEYDVDKIYNLCRINDDLNRGAFLREYKNKVADIYECAQIVKMISCTGDYCKKSLLNCEKKIAIIVPFYDGDKQGFWNLFRKFTKEEVPLCDEVEFWRNISPKNEISIKKFLEIIESDNREVDKDIAKQESEENYFNLINTLHDMCFDEQNEKYSQSVRYLNQKYKFKDTNELFIDDGVDDVLKNIAEGLGIDIRTRLIHHKMKVHLCSNVAKFSNEELASEMCTVIRKRLSNEANGIPRDENTQRLYNQLTDWFFKNSEKAKVIFCDIYEKQHLLTKPEETIRRLKLANDIEELMKKQNIDFASLSEIVDKSVSLAKEIGSEDELSEEIKEMLKHISKGTIWASEYFRKIMERTIRNVYEALSKNRFYEVADSFEEWEKTKLSDTVYWAKKDGREIQIIIRPSDNSKIIFYEDQEFEALDDHESELWTDDGCGHVFAITLGDLLKTTGITQIPLKKIIK